MYTLSSPSQVFEMPRRSGLRRSRSILDEATSECEPQSGKDRENYSPEIATNAKRVRWDSTSDLQDEPVPASSDSSGPVKVRYNSCCLHLLFILPCRFVWAYSVSSEYLSWVHFTVLCLICIPVGVSAAHIMIPSNALCMCLKTLKKGHIMTWQKWVGITACIVCSFKFSAPHSLGTFGSGICTH